MQKTQTIETLVRDGFILVFNQNKLDVVETARALLDAGIHNVEVTCRINQPLEKITRLRKELPEMLVGAASLIDSPAMLNRYNAAHPDDPLPTVAQAVDQIGEHATIVIIVIIVAGPTGQDLGQVVGELEGVEVTQHDDPAAAVIRQQEVDIIVDRLGLRLTRRLSGLYERLRAAEDRRRAEARREVVVDHREFISVELKHT